MLIWRMAPKAESVTACASCYLLRHQPFQQWIGEASPALNYTIARSNTESSGGIDLELVQRVAFGQA